MNYDEELVSRYFMNDNHTFIQLSSDDLVALDQIAEAFENDPYGMLCAHHKNIGNVGLYVHCQGPNNFAKFMEEAASWLKKTREF